jgi:hypothetical protein
MVIFGGSGALFETRSWEEVGRLLPTSKIYKIEVLGSLRHVHIRINSKEFDSQSQFYAGKPLRRATLQAISGSFSQPFSVSSVVLGS